VEWPSFLLKGEAQW